MAGLLGGFDGFGYMAEIGSRQVGGELFWLIYISGCHPRIFLLKLSKQVLIRALDKPKRFH